MVTTVAATLQKFLIPYAQHFRGLGWCVEAAAREAPERQDLVEAFDVVHDLPLSRSVKNVAGIARGALELRRLLDREFDIMHVHTPIASLLARGVVSRMPETKRPAVIYTTHGFHFNWHGRAATNVLFLLAERIGGRWTDRLVVINDDDEAAARRHRIVPASRLVRMPGIGVDTQHYSAELVPEEARAGAREELGIPPEAPLFVVIGELNTNKRPADPLRALALTGRSQPHLAYLGDGPLHEDLLRLADEAGLRGRVHLCGNVPDIRPLTVTATAGILASTREGLPRSIMEAFSLEVPVIASDARGSTELVRDDAGLIYPVGDVPQLAAAMERLLDAPELCAGLGVVGRARVVAEYDQARVIHLHEQLYEQVLGEAAWRDQGGSP